MENNEDSFSVDLKPTKDDIELRQRQLQKKRHTSSVKDTSSASSNGLIMVAFLVAFIATGVGGFALWKLMAVQDKLSQADAFLSKLDSATESLQESVSETGAKASLSAGALKSLVKENNSEIRKLWYVANERNKKAIAANGKEISTYKKEMEKQQKAMAESHKQELEALNNTIAQLERVLNDKLKQQKQAHAKLEARTNQLKKSVSSLPEVELRMGQNEELLQDLESQIKSLRKQTQKN